MQCEEIFLTGLCEWLQWVDCCRSHSKRVTGSFQVVNSKLSEALKDMHRYIVMD